MKDLRHHSNWSVEISGRWAAAKWRNLCCVIQVLGTSVHDFRKEEKGKRFTVMLVSGQTSLRKHISQPQC